MSAKKAISDAMAKHVNAFVDGIRESIATIDVSEFVQEREEAVALVRMLRAILIHKQITPEMGTEVVGHLEKRCSVWLARIEGGGS